MGSIHDLLPERTNTVAVQVSAAGHVPGACIYDVQAPDADGVFHPKVWALRFIAGDGAIGYRVLCLSRNLTFDRCWDTVVTLDGELTDRSNAISPSRAATIQLRSPSGPGRRSPYESLGAPELLDSQPTPFVTCA